MQSRHDSPATQAAFLIAMPLAWAVLLWFHPDVDAGRRLRQTFATRSSPIRSSTSARSSSSGSWALRSTCWSATCPGRPRAISRLAIGPFVLFYGAWETVIGLATGALVQHAQRCARWPATGRGGRHPEPGEQRHHR